MRIIARMDVKGNNLVKTINLEGLRVVGDCVVKAFDYYKQNIDEIVYLDSVASLYGRNHLSNVVQETAENIFIPICVGGGVRSLDNALELLEVGADKISINTAAIENPKLIDEISSEIGSQSLIVSIDAKRTSSSNWEALKSNGKERTGVNIKDWIREVEDRGAGEILLTSVDNEGTGAGIDQELIENALIISNIPIIYSGGVANLEQLKSLSQFNDLSGVAFAGLLHYSRSTVSEIRSLLKSQNIYVREI